MPKPETDPDLIDPRVNGAPNGRVREPVPQPTGPEKITVNLTVRSTRSLLETMQLREETKTEVVNRAIQIYAYLQEIWDQGGTVYVKDTPKSDLERLKVF